MGCHGQVSTGSGDSEVPGIRRGLGCAGRVLGLLRGAAQTEVLLLQRGRLGSRPGHQTLKQRPATDLWGDPRLVPSPLGLSFPCTGPNGKWRQAGPGPGSRTGLGAMPGVGGGSPCRWGPHHGARPHGALLRAGWEAWSSSGALSRCSRNPHTRGPRVGTLRLRAGPAARGWTETLRSHHFLLILNIL